MPMQSPTSSKAALTGCSGRASVRGVATPLRSSCKRASASKSKSCQDLNAPTPRVLHWCDCGTCPSCLSECAIFGNERASSVMRDKVMELTDIASPGPSSPGPSAGDCLMPEQLCSGEVVPEIPMRTCITGLSQSSSDLANDPRIRPSVFLPLLVIPVNEAAAAPRSDPRLGSRALPAVQLCSTVQDDSVSHQSVPSQGSQASSDPRRRRRMVLKEPIQAATPRKRPLSPSLMPPAPQCPRSPTHPASCRARRYRRSPTPCPDNIPMSSGRGCCRDRSPTPAPSGSKRTASRGYGHLLAGGI